MIFSYNWLQSFFKKRLPEPKKLAELLTMKAFEVTEVKRSGKDFVLDIDVLPNRACDCFSHLGIAREIAAIAGLNYRSLASPVSEDKNLKVKDFVRVEVKNKIACPRYTARVVTDVKIDPSPKWIENRLKACGLKPINNVVDIANYVMLETGQPLHAFDGEKLEGGKIVIRFAKNREKIVTLDEEKYDLTENILVIADAKKPVAIAGIKGGKIPEIAKSTKIVVIESANFEPGVIRRASKKLGLITDASLRFEHGIDPNLTEMAINLAACLIQKVAHPQGGYPKIAKGLVDFYPKKVLAKKIRLDLDYVERLLGVKISVTEIKNILKRLDFQLIDFRNQSMMVKVPTRRLDVSLPEDLIEEIGRIVGFEKIKAAFPTSTLIPPKRNINRFWEGIVKNILKETRFSEVYNYSFIGEKEAKIFGKKNLIEVENPISIEQKYLRASLIPHLLESIQKNQTYFASGSLNQLSRGNEIRIFELGKIFQKSKTEKRQLSGVIATMSSTHHPAEPFYRLKGVTDLLLRKLGISNIWYDSWQPTPDESELSIWHPKKCAEIKVNHQELGFLGEINPKILEELKIRHPVVIFDIDFEKLQQLASEETIYQPISRFPAAVRDLAILVPRGTKVVDVLNKINIAGSSLVRDVDIFDIYEGEELPEGKKNLAFHIIYQVEGRTLKSAEIDEIHQKIIKALEKNPEWQVRK